MAIPDPSNGTIELPLDKVEKIAAFIDETLQREWDRYTDYHICRGVSEEQGKARMDPEMYSLLQELQQLLNA